MKNVLSCLSLFLGTMSLTTGQTWEVFHSGNSLMPAGGANVVYVDPSGGKWFGTAQGLVHYANDNWARFTTSDGLAGEQITGISGVKGALNPKLYVGSTQGFSEVSMDGSGKVHIESYSSLNSGLNSDSITAIHNDSGTLLFGTPVGLDIHFGETWMFLNQISIGEVNESIEQISTMASTPDGWNFIGMRERGVARLQVDVDGVTGASSFSTEWSGLLSDNIYDIYVTETGNQWYATDKGLAYHEGYNTKENWETYTELSSGLVSNQVYCVAMDGQATIWAGTDQGIARFDGSYWLSYTTVNGMQEIAVYDMDMDMDGSIWFASSLGAIHYDEYGIPDGIVIPGRIEGGLQLELQTIDGSNAITIVYDGPLDSRVSLFLVDLHGRILHQLANHPLSDGPYSLTLPVNEADLQLAAGVYFICAHTDNERLTRKIFVKQ